MLPIKAAVILFLLPFLSVTCNADPDSAKAAYKSGDYKTAIPLLRAAVAQDAKDPILCADLLSALVYEGQVDEASDLEETALAQFPNSPEAIAARGEFFFYMGDLGQAETLFRAAIRLKDDTPRAVFGMYRVCRAVSMYRKARLLCLKAHETDPDDARITVAWLPYLMPEKRKELLGPFVKAHPWFYKRFEENTQTETDVRHQLNEKEEFQLEGPKQETTLSMVYLMNGPNYIRGVGLRVAIEGGKPLNLLFDTGASGILLNQAAVDKAGLAHVGSFQINGIGDKGMRNSFATVAEDCTIGTLKFKNCVFGATEGKGKVGGEEDGLIGADFFSDYVIGIDFQKRLLHLKPQPERDPNPQGYDRTVPRDETDFTPVLRFGHHLFVTTKVNGKSTGLFLLDTGASLSTMDSTFARLSTKIHGDDYMRVHGVSGEVKNVFEAEKAELQFAHFRQHNLGLTSFDLNNLPEHQEVRMAGILGMPVLALFRLTIDYRNGLVNLDYIKK